MSGIRSAPRCSDFMRKGLAVNATPYDLLEDSRVLPGLDAQPRIKAPWIWGEGGGWGDEIGCLRRLFVYSPRPPTRPLNPSKGRGTGFLPRQPNATDFRFLEGDDFFAGKRPTEQTDHLKLFEGS